MTVTTRYEIVIAGDPGPLIAVALPGFEAGPGPAGSTRLQGLVRDQAALQGVLHQLHDLHVELLEVRQIDE